MAYNNNNNSATSWDGVAFWLCCAVFILCMTTCAIKSDEQRHQEEMKRLELKTGQTNNK